MSKKKKGKVVSLKPTQQSPENYIKTMARTLPIAECLVTEDWKDTGICNVIVARKHKTGNITCGIYLVDLYCLGVKDAYYYFNTDPDEFDYMKAHSGNIEACDYVLAHNIIYGAVAFAEDYGFKPHKDFAVAQYILEEDDDNIELIELEFGFEGMPFYMNGPYDEPAKIERIRNTLLQTAGEGNFKIIEDESDIDDWFEGDDDLFEDEDYDDGISEEQEEILEQVLNTLKPVSKVYEKAIRTAEGKAMLKNSTIGKAYKLTQKPVITEFNSFENPEQEKHYELMLELFNNSDFDTAIKSLKKAIIQYPGRPQFYNLMQACYIFSEQFEKSDELTMEMYKKFPDYLFAMIPYANMLIDKDEPEDAFAVLHGKADLNELYPGQKQFNRHEAAIYYATMCRYFVAIGDIDAADLYINIIFKKELQYTPNQTLVNKALMDICDAKVEKVKTLLSM